MNIKKYQFCSWQLTQTASLYPCWFEKVMSSNFRSLRRTIATATQILPIATVHQLQDIEMQPTLYACIWRLVSSFSLSDVGPLWRNMFLKDSSMFSNSACKAWKNNRCLTYFNYKRKPRVDRADHRVQKDLFSCGQANEEALLINQGNTVLNYGQNIKYWNKSECLFVT